MALCLALGHIVAFGYRVRVRRPVPPGEYSCHREYSITVGLGHIELEQWTVSYHRWSTIIEFPDGLWIGRPQMPRLRYFIEVRDRHSGPTHRSNSTITSDAFSFPTWCAVLPCLIAQLLWLRRRRTARSGFEVIADDN
jgi:hypothetical protein